MLTTIEKILFLIILAGFISYVLMRARELALLVRMGRTDPRRRTDNLAQRIIGMALDVFLQRRVLRKPVTGALHLLIVWGFFVFAVNTINHFAGALFPGFHLLGNNAAADYYTALADIFAVLIITGVVGLAIRRYVFRPESLTPRSFESAVVFFFIGGAMVAYLFANATEIALEASDNSGYHVVAGLLSTLFANMQPAPLRVIAHVAWWCDALMHLALILLLVIPTKHLHLAAGPLNLVFRRVQPMGQMTKIDIEDEEAETFGVSKIEEFTWKQNLDLYACIECGRCRDYCPTVNSGKPLNPKELIVGLKEHLLEVGPAVLAARKNANGEIQRPALIGDVVTKETLWSCTTCGNCVEHCPMGIEHIDKITDMRAHLVLMEADFPAEADAAFRNMETKGNPWGFAPAERRKWAEGLDVPVMADKQQADILWWVGCSGSYDERSKKISVAMAKILNAAGVDFAILGDEERCNCESARRLGNEYLYQTATQEIIETLKQYQFKRIVTTCPHCYNTFKNEYPLFDAVWEVVHHTEFIQELIQGNRLPLTATPAREPTVFHDSCYLGRYNRIYDAPRRVLQIAGCALLSIARERERGFCCGAGGGQMWLEEQGESISGIRTDELMASGAARIAAACPFCITMLSDGVKDKGGNASVLDVAEIVAANLAP